MWEDPIIKETRKIRREIESECGNDFEEIVKRAIEIQKRYSKRVVSKPSGLNKEREPVSVDRVF